MEVVREGVTPDRECRLVSLTHPYEGMERRTPFRLGTSWREGLWKGGTEKCRKVGEKEYGPDQRIERDRILVIHRSYLRRRMEYRPPSIPIPWPHPGRQP